MKEVVTIGCLYFDKHKFKKHLKRRKSDGMNTENQYIKKIKDIVLNFDRVFEVKRKRNKDQYNLFVSKTGWVVLFSINDFMIHSCLKMYEGFTPDDFLQFMKDSDKALLSYKEVDYENDEFQRIIRKIQKDIK